MTITEQDKERIDKAILDLKVKHGNAKYYFEQLCVKAERAASNELIPEELQEFNSHKLAAMHILGISGDYRTDEVIFGLRELMNQIEELLE